MAICNIAFQTVYQAKSTVRRKAVFEILQVWKNDIPLRRVKQEYIKNSQTQLLVLVL